ncbi:hypothetical protein TAMA11512_02870 [Selenomonas sp. TAMA-11512]|uniref:glycosyltransferase family 2 protein n=1 Tax=Selenomonas sp. TAMA-11512 TaxID=3095337 RepID=UPI00309056E8|nr:hypothetical protein TAMA11512_02870 [Selenomonas sp. TAMA-11512]
MEQVGPKISIVTVTYNSVKTLEQTIVSVSRQTYKNLEYIIVDGGSTDGTLNLIEKYKSCITRAVSEPDRGIYDAMNKGVALATGDYVEFIGSDDALAERDVIEKVVGQMYSDVDILSGNAYFVDEASRREYLYTNDFARDKKAYRGGMVPHAAVFARRDLLKKYPFSIEYRMLADYRFFLQCYFDDAIRIQYVDTPVLYYSLAGISSTATADAAGEEKLSIYRELGLCDTLYQTEYIRYRKKKKLQAIGAFSLIKKIRDYARIMLRGKKHVCDNPICRWCGRG